MKIGYGIDPAQGLERAAEEEVARLARGLGYSSAWTPSRGDPESFERCSRWHLASGLPTGIAVVPASDREPGFYADLAARLWEESRGHFVLGVGSGRIEHPLAPMRSYLGELRRALPEGPPVYLAALGPSMLRLAGEIADGVLLNWCTAAQVARSRELVAKGAARVGRKPPRLAGYIRTAVDADPELAFAALEAAARGYALGPPAYRRHFAKMGFAGEIAEGAEAGGQLSRQLVSSVGAFGAPGQVREQVTKLAQGLDLAIVRVLVAHSGDLDSARAVLEECRPA